MEKSGDTTQVPGRVLLQDFSILISSIWNIRITDKYVSKSCFLANSISILTWFSDAHKHLIPVSGPI